MIALLAVVVAASSPIPVIKQRIGETTLFFTADRAWSLHPDDCVNIKWEVEGISEIYVEQRGEIGHGEKSFCPAINDKAARFEARTPDGLKREYDLRIDYLPDLLLYLAGFVGVVGSLGLAAYFLITNRMDTPLNPRWVVITLAALVLVGTALRLNEPEPPRLEADDGQVKVAMWAEKASLAFPQEMVEVEFSVAGAESVRIHGEEVLLERGWAQFKSRDSRENALALEVSGADGGNRVFELPIPALFGALSHLPVFYYLGLFAWLLAAPLYLPMAAESCRKAFRRGERADLAAVCAFASLSLILASAIGLDPLPIFENALMWAHFEGRLDAFASEFPARFFLALTTSLAYFAHNDSYAGFSVAHYMVTALLPLLFYGVLRKFGVRASFAFMIAALFFVYPVNDLRMSPRFLVNNSSILWLLLAVYCALDWLKTERRRSLAGAALALLFNVGSYEAGLGLLLALPLLLPPPPPPANTGKHNRVMATPQSGAALHCRSCL